MARRRWEVYVPPLWPYVALFSAVVDRRVTIAEFEVIFLAMYKNDVTPWPKEVFSALDTVFGAVDDFCEEEALRAEVHGLGPNEVVAEVERCLARLNELKEGEDRSAL